MGTQPNIVQGIAAASGLGEVINERKVPKLTIQNRNQIRDIDLPEFPSEEARQMFLNYLQRLHNPPKKKYSLKEELKYFFDDQKANRRWALLLGLIVLLIVFGAM